MSSGLPHMSASCGRLAWLDLIKRFTEAAIELRERVLAVIPLGGRDGKAALKRPLSKWSRRLRSGTVASWARRG